MEFENIKKYLEKEVFIRLKNGYVYTFYLSNDSINNNTISFKDKFNIPIDIDISEISFISYARIFKNGKS